MELSALVTGVRALAALAAWGAAAAELLELGPVPESAAVASCAAGVAVEVTAEAADVTALVTGLAEGGVIAELDAPVVVADEGAGALGGGVLGESVALVAAVVP